MESGPRLSASLAFLHIPACAGIWKEIRRYWGGLAATGVRRLDSIRAMVRI